MDNFNANVKTIEHDEADFRSSFRSIDSERTLSKLRDDCQSMALDPNSQSIAKKVFDQVSTDNAKAHLPNLLIFDGTSNEIKVDPKVTENVVLDGASKRFEDIRHQTIDQAIKADATAVAHGQTDSLRDDLLGVWKAAGTPGVHAFVSKLNEQLQTDQSGVSLRVPAVSRGGVKDLSYDSPLCHPQIVKNGQVIGDVRVY